MIASTLTCPQCGAPLPRQALWRTVTCAFCAADVTRGADIVHASAFREAYLRAHATPATGARTIICRNQRYQVLAHLGRGDNADVVLAQRTGPFAERVVIKTALASAAPGRLKTEMDILTRLQADTAPGAAYFSQRLPQAVACGVADDSDGGRGEALVLRHAVGYWGSLTDVKLGHAHGIDPRHAVWMWRRTLEVLGHIHASGWVHGNLRPEHLLVQPRDHGILIIGWAGARQRGGGHTPARDLMQSAWAIRAMLCGGAGRPAIPAATPAPLAKLLERASEDASWCAAIDAQELDAALVAAARAAFGPAKFTPFNPAAPT